MATTHYRGTADEVRAIIHTLSAALAGRIPDPWGVVNSVQLRMCVSLLSKVQQAFLVKSRGGTGDDGITWKPLKPATIAQRRTTAAERKAAGITGKRVRGLLTPDQDRRWRGIYAIRLAALRASGVPNAEATAARIAWGILKAQGARTKLAVFGNRKVDIGRDTGRMFKSLSPGKEATPSGEAEQILETPPGRLIVGSNVPYVDRFHRDRPLWPPDGTLPAPWASAVAAAGARGIALALTQMLRGPT